MACVAVSHEVVSENSNLCLLFFFYIIDDINNSYFYYDAAVVQLSQYVYLQAGGRAEDHDRSHGDWRLCLLGGSDDEEVGRTLFVCFGVLWFLSWGWDGCEGCEGCRRTVDFWGPGGGRTFEGGA